MNNNDGRLVSFGTKSGRKKQETHVSLKRHGLKWKQALDGFFQARAAGSFTDKFKKRAVKAMTAS